MSNLFETNGEIEVVGIGLNSNDAQTKPGYIIEARARDVHDHLFLSITGKKPGHVKMMVQIDGMPARVFQHEYEAGFDARELEKRPYPFYYPAAFRTVGVHKIEVLTGTAQKDETTLWKGLCGPFLIKITEPEDVE